MNVSRLMKCLAASAGALLAGNAMAVGGYTVSLVTADSCTSNGHVLVNVQLNVVGGSTVAGAQVFLNYNSFLSATNASITAGPGLQGIVLSASNVTHKATIAVGVTAPAQTINDGDIIATIDFTYGSTSCATPGLVSIDAGHVPASALTNNLAQSLSFTTSNLGSITLGDSTAPVINSSNPLANISQGTDAGVCTWTSTVTAPGFTDDCSATLSATIDGNPYNWALNNTFDVGTTVIIWKATDGCGHFTTAAQNVVIVDGQYPTIDCGDNQFVNADAGVCTATLVPTAPSFSDNCPGPVLTATINGDPYTPGTSHAFPRGLTEVHWRVTDAHGNATTCIHNVTVSDTQIPIFDTCPGPISENADAGGCTYTFSPVHPTFHDNCDANALITLTATLDGSPYDYVSFPSLTLGTGMHTIIWTATDTSSNQSTPCTQTITISNSNTLAVFVELAGTSSMPVNAPFTRCITFKLYRSGPCALATTVTKDITFTNGLATNATGTALIDVPCASGTYTGITATDTHHTLRRTAAVSISTPVYVATLTGSAALEGGNVNNDAYIDILDFGGYIGQFGTSPGASTTCAAGLNADFSGNGSVGTEDFTFVQSGFLHSRDADPCGGAITGDAPVSDISVTDLVARGLRSYALADFNLDGRLNAADITYVSQHGLPLCAADFNDDQATDVSDIFTFLNAWFADHPKADLNSNNRADVQDIFSFLDVWFQGC